MRLAPRLAISLTLSAACLGAKLAGAEATTAALAVATVASWLVPSARALPIAAGAAVAGGVTLLLAALPGATRLLLESLPLVGNLMLAWHFGATLRAGREPLISRYTRADHGHMPAELVGYTRRLTMLWTLFFLAFSAANAATLAGFGPPAGASAVANVALALLFFLGEHAVRAARFGHLGPAHPWRTLRAIWRADARQSHAG
jgi:uncharacterized membrane protein